MSNFFPEQKVKVLKSEDFKLDTDDKITIKEKFLTVVLFLDTSGASERLKNTWTNLSKSVAGIKYAACNLIEESDVALAFSSLASDSSSPYKKFANHIPPFIILYREGRPQKLYAGTSNEHDLKIWCLQQVANLTKLSEIEDSDDIKSLSEYNSENEDDLPKALK